MRVRLIQDDVDRHGEGCDCGLCSLNGKSFGVGIYDATNDDGTDAAFDQIRESDPYDRAYGCSEQAAMDAARALCTEKGWKVIGGDEFPTIEPKTEGPYREGARKDMEGIVVKRKDMEGIVKLKGKIG